ncbi:hypothetical protein FIV07_27955 (plasmid) [Mycobacterium sp. THAF192]|nr:hypothetical protein FIV07_27955 [Mycobacterium sp. THAF192]
MTEHMTAHPQHTIRRRQLHITRQPTKPNVVRHQQHTIKPTTDTPHQLGPTLRRRVQRRTQRPRITSDPTNRVPRRPSNVGTHPLRRSHRHHRRSTRTDTSTHPARRNSRPRCRRRRGHRLRRTTHTTGRRRHQRRQHATTHRRTHTTTSRRGRRRDRRSSSGRRRPRKRRRRLHRRRRRRRHRRNRTTATPPTRRRWRRSQRRDRRIVQQRRRRSLQRLIECRRGHTLAPTPRRTRSPRTNRRRRTPQRRQRRRRHRRRLRHPTTTTNRRRHRRRHRNASTRISRRHRQIVVETSRSRGLCDWAQVSPRIGSCIRSIVVERRSSRCFSFAWLMRRVVALRIVVGGGLAATGVFALTPTLVTRLGALVGIVHATPTAASLVSTGGVRSFISRVRRQRNGTSARPTAHRRRTRPFAETSRIPAKASCCLAQLTGDVVVDRNQIDNGCIDVADVT